MFKRNLAVTVILILFSFTATGFAAADKYHWELADTEDGCQIFISEVRGKDYIAAKASCVIPARADVVGMVIRDIASYPEWMDGCKGSKMLKVLDDEKDVFIFWVRQHVPVLADRDVVIKSKIDIDDKGRVLIYGNATKEIRYDADEDYVRMPSFSSLFTLQWIDQNHTQVTYMIDPDLGKGLPLGIANRTIQSTPYKTLKKMMKMVKNSKYTEGAKKSKYSEMVEVFATDTGKKN